MQYFHHHPRYFIASLSLMLCILHLLPSHAFFQKTQCSTFLWEFIGFQSDDQVQITQVAFAWSVTGYIDPSQPRVSQCTTTDWIMGGINLMHPQGSLVRTYTNLASAHTSIYYSCLVYMIGGWMTGDSFSLQFDTGTVQTFTLLSNPPTPTTFQCGAGPSFDTDRVAVVGKVQHSASSVTVKISWNILSSTSATVSFGIHDLVMLFGTWTADDVEQSYIAAASASYISRTSGCDSGSIDTSSACPTCTQNYLCFGSSVSQGYKPYLGSTYDGTQTVACTTNCRSCTGSGTNQCYGCNTGYVVDYDGSCKTSCSAGYTAVGTSYYQTCVTPCTTGQFMLYDGSCVSSCNAPLTQDTTTSPPGCSSPCGLSTTSFLKWDGSCVSTCPYYIRTQYNYQLCDACQPGYYSYSNGSCFASCYSTFTVATTGGSQFCNYPCTGSTFLYANGSCLSTCQSLFGQRVEGTYNFCDYPCSSGQYLYLNGSCLSTCQSLFVSRTEGTYQFCTYPCSSSQYLYLNGSCLSTCQSLFTSRTEGTYQFCTYPCASGQYLYLNSSCLSTCQTLFIPRTEGTYQFCTYPCSSGQYLYQNNSCLSTCQSLFVSRTESTYQFCTYPCSSAQYLYLNSSCLSVCQPSFVLRTEGSYQFCTYPCASGQYLYPNNSCLSTCQPLFASRTEGTYQFCTYPCSSGQYLYLNGSCLSTCQSLFIPRTEGTYQFCTYPCDSGQYLYLNGSCLSTCQSLFVSRTEGTYQFCTYPCSSAQYLYLNGSCLSTCQSLFIARTEGTYQFCTYPCDSSQYLYLNGSCLPTCQSLFISRTEGTYQFCTYPCSSGQYLYLNSSCLPTCQSLFIPRTEGTYQFCTHPCSSGQYLYFNGSCLSTCQSLFINRTEGTYQFCTYPCSSGQYLYPNSSCLSTCQSLFIPRTEGPYQFCSYPCSSDKYLYLNGSCLSTCQTLFSSRIEGTYRFCTYPCSSAQYLYPNGSCLSTCLSLFTIRTEGNYQFCDNPCSPTDYLYPDKTCSPKCEVPFTPQPQGSFRFCVYMCSNGTFFYPDYSTCRSRCTYPYKLEIPTYYCILDLSGAQVQQIKAVTQVTAAASTTTSMVSTAAVAGGPTNPSVLLISSLSNMLTSIRYINVSYPPKVRMMLNSQSLLDVISTLLPSVTIYIDVMIPTEPLPAVFEKYNEPSSFLANFWGPLFMFAVLMIILGLSILVVCIGQKCPMPTRLCSVIKNTLRWNFCLSLLISYYGPIVFFSSLQFYTANAARHSVLGFISLVVCIGVNTVALLVFIKIVQVIRETTKSVIDSSSTNHSNETSPTEMKSAHHGSERFAVLSEEYKDGSWMQRSFIAIYMVRVCLFYFIIAYMFTYPIVQSVLMCILNVAMLLYVGMTRSMKSKLDHYQFMLQEVGLLVINICVAILAVSGPPKDAESSVRGAIADAIVWSNTASQILTCLYSVIKIIVQIVAMSLYLKKWLKRRKRKILVSEESRMKRSGLSFALGFSESSFGSHTTQLDASFTKPGRKVFSRPSELDISVDKDQQNKGEVSMQDSRLAEIVEECEDEDKKDNMHTASNHHQRRGLPRKWSNSQSYKTGVFKNKLDEIKIQYRPSFDAPKSDRKEKSTTDGQHVEFYNERIKIFLGWSDI